MRVLSFTPTREHLNQLALGRVEFKRLGQTVLLAGPNGGGKTRILELLRAVASNRRGTRARGVPDPDDMVLSNMATRPSVVNFVPRELHGADPLGLTRDSLQSEFAHVLNQPGIDGVSRRCFVYIQGLQDLWWNATHPNFSGSAEQRESAVSQYQSLLVLLRALLGIDLERSPDGAAQVAGKPLAKVPFSEGQHVLLHMAVAVHPVRDDGPLILTLDEPENHLHPAVLIAVLDKITTALPGAQIWIATHSVPLIAHLYTKDPACLHFVADGSVSHAGRKPEVVLAGLLGNEAEQQKLLHFIDLPHALAATQFAVESLVDPGVADHAAGDKQLSQVCKGILSRSNADSPVRLLDLGAGKGRLLGGLEERLTDTKEVIDYVAFDVSSQHKEICERQILSVYGSSEGRWHTDPNNLFIEKGEHAFDVVVLCNVLHEIDPAQWLSIVGSNGIVARSLRPTGYLLVIEDLRIPVGERPNQAGFFLLDTLQLRQLFKVGVGELDKIEMDSRDDGRLKAHWIPREFVERADASSRTGAIQSLRLTAFEELKKIRRDGSSAYKAGLLHGLWSQQFASCCIYLES